MGLKKDNDCILLFSFVWQVQKYILFSEINRRLSELMLQMEEEFLIKQISQTTEKVE